MIAILGGLTAALCWAVANLVSSRSTRLIGADSTLGAMMLVGLLLATPLAVASGPLAPIQPSTAVWIVVAGTGSVVGLLLFYRALRIGKVGVVTGLASTEGAIAAVISILAGERLTLPAVLMLGLIAAGVVAVAVAAGTAASQTAFPVDDPTDPAMADVAAVESDVRGLAPTQNPIQHHDRQATMFGIAAALCFGLGVYATGQLGLVLPPFVALLPPRVGGVMAVFISLALTGRLHLTRRAIPMVIAIGSLEVLGNAAYIVGARQSIAISAVLASQFAALAAVGAFFLFHERLSPRQRNGIVAIAVGVALMTAVRA